MMEDSKQNSVLRDSKNTSLWQATARVKSGLVTPVGNQVDKLYDCLVIGAGITGITMALL